MTIENKNQLCDTAIEKFKKYRDSIESSSAGRAIIHSATFILAHDGKDIAVFVVAQGNYDNLEAEINSEI